MLKRLCLALAGLFCVVSLAQAAGTVPGFSLTPQFDLSGHVAPGCRLYIIQAGTTSTPQNAYQDSALTIPQPNPMTCDAGGRLSQFFLADGLIKLRLTTSTGTQIFVGDNLLVVGASGGGGGGGTVDPTTILATGDIKVSYGTGILSGFVRANGRTIGSSTSGATERANSDCQALFVYLWGADANLTVSGGRGASGAADWAANKTIALPDWRGRALAGLDDMGNTAAGVLTSAYFGTAPTALGASGGSQSLTLIQDNLPALPLSISGNVTVTTTNQLLSSNAQVTAFSKVDGGGVGFAAFGAGSTQVVTFQNSTGTVTSGSTANMGLGTAQPNVTPTKLATIYVKL